MLLESSVPRRRNCQSFFGASPFIGFAVPPLLFGLQSIHARATNMSTRVYDTFERVRSRLHSVLCALLYTYSLLYIVLYPTLYYRLYTRLRTIHAALYYDLHWPLRSSRLSPTIYSTTRGKRGTEQKHTGSNTKKNTGSPTTTKKNYTPPTPARTAVGSSQTATERTASPARRNLFKKPDYTPHHTVRLRSVLVDVRLSYIVIRISYHTIFPFTI